MIAAYKCYIALIVLNDNEQRVYYYTASDKHACREKASFSCAKHKLTSQVCCSIGYCAKLVKMFITTIQKGFEGQLPLVTNVPLMIYFTRTACILDDKKKS